MKEQKKRRENFRKEPFCQNIVTEIILLLFCFLWNIMTYHITKSLIHSLQPYLFYSFSRSSYCYLNTFFSIYYFDSYLCLYLLMLREAPLLICVRIYENQLGQFTHVWHFIAGGIFCPYNFRIELDAMGYVDGKRAIYIGHVKPSLLFNALKLNGINNTFSIAHFTAVKYVCLNLCGCNFGKILQMKIQADMDEVDR